MRTHEEGYRDALDVVLYRMWKMMNPQSDHYVEDIEKRWTSLMAELTDRWDVARNIVQKQEDTK